MSIRIKLAAKFLMTAGAVAVTARAYSQSTCTNGYRVVAQRYDALLHKSWELRQDCLHPGWPVHSIAIANIARLSGDNKSLSTATAAPTPPVLVRAGEPVRLWSQDLAARIEIAGIAEQSAHLGEHIDVRITHQTDENGLTVQDIAGIVRAAGSVEIAQ